MSESAAFFDLDRTLLRGASGPVLSAAMRRSGAMRDRAIPGEAALFKVFDLVGETYPAMLATRQAARLSAGRPRQAYLDAGEAAAGDLLAAAAPFGLHLLEEHRDAGRKVVLATTTPHDLIRPFAERVGFDGILATRYGVDAEGRYDGTIDGPFVWGPGKLEAVRTWAEANGVKLTESYAYSDSFYDVPLLSAVGHATAVNPDARLRVVARARRWPIRHFDVPPGVPKVLGLEPQRALQALARPEMVPYARFDIAGEEKIPKTGGALIVANHRSYFDSMAVGLLLAKVGRPVRFLGKKEVFDAPVVGQLAQAMGGIRVDRGTGSDEPLHAAAQALKAGELVALMPQGTIPRGPAFFDPELKGRWGAARLAAQSGVPVIPVGLWGTDQVWPRSARLPHVLNVTNPPLVTVRVGDPVPLGHEDVDADTRAIMAAITELLPPVARERVEPSAAQLARTYPPGYKGHPEKETHRRPGTD